MFYPFFNKKGPEFTLASTISIIQADVCFSPKTTVLSPLLGQTYQRAKAADTKEQFLRSREATSAAVTWSTSLVGSALQSYGVGALINATGTLSYKGAAYLGSLIFLATSAPTVSLPPPKLPLPVS